MISYIYAESWVKKPPKMVQIPMQEKTEEEPSCKNVDVQYFL